MAIKKTKRKLPSSWIAKPTSTGLYIYRHTDSSTVGGSQFRVFSVIKRGRGFAAVDANDNVDKPFVYKIAQFKGEWQPLEMCNE